MNDFESVVAKCHADIVAAGHSWAQPRLVSMADREEAARLPHEWISAPAEKRVGRDS